MVITLVSMNLHTRCGLSTEGVIYLHSHILQHGVPSGFWAQFCLFLKLFCVTGQSEMLFLTAGLYSQIVLLEMLC